MSPANRLPSAGNGIPVLSRAGGFGRHMWARRWISDLEGLADRRDVHMARTDARNRRVLSIQHSGATVHLDVAGSRPLPFTVTFTFDPLDDVDTAALAELLRSHEGGIVAALAGQFDDQVGFRLLPAVHGHTRWECPCPVVPGPCRHVLAAGCVLVEWWDRDPGVLFPLRGMDTASLGVSAAGSTDTLDADIVDDLWGSDPVLPALPSPQEAGIEDLLDGPVAHRLATATTSDPIEHMRVVADLEDFYSAFRRYHPEEHR